MKNDNDEMILFISLLVVNSRRMELKSNAKRERERERKHFCVLNGMNGTTNWLLLSYS